MTVDDFNEIEYNPLTPKFALQLAAPHSWAASVTPALFGILFCAYRGLPLGIPSALMLFIACICLQSSVNTLNDYIDFIKGTDSKEDNVEVSDATLVYANIDPKHALILGCAYLAAGAALGIAVCVMHEVYTPLIIGVIGAAVVVLYSGGPLPISYLPVGEFVSGFVMGGLIPLGIAACADGNFHPEILVWSLPYILGIALIMMSNNGCDIEKDRRAGRWTLPTILGRRKTLNLYRALMVSWIALLAVMPVLLVGPIGLLSAVLILIRRKNFTDILKLHLLPEERILHMKGIAAANIKGNGAYIITLLVAVAWAALRQ